MKGFIDFIRSQGVVGLAVAFIMGASITKLITSFVNDLINPLIGLLFNSIGELENAYIQIASTRIPFGSFISSLIDFLIISIIIYFGVKVLGIKNLDKKKKK
jgi:large conductance mechanosensitive channel